MIRMILFLYFLFSAALAFADANDGEYLGYQLGDKFQLPRGAKSSDHIIGATVYYFNPRQQPHHIDSVSIYVTPKSSIIGSIFGEWYFPSERSAQDFADRYLATLQDKYPDWLSRDHSLTHNNYQLWVDVEQKPPVVEHWPSRKEFRVAVGLIFAPESLGRNEWMAMIDREINNVELTASE